MKATVLVHEAETLETLRRILVDVDIEYELASGSLNQFTDTEAVVGNLLIAEAGGNMSELAVAERITTHHPHLALLLVAADPSRDFLLEAMHRGVREVLALPLEPEAVREVLMRLRKRISPKQLERGKVIAFQPSKGGSGATFLASNLAYVLASEGKRTALIDLNLQFGDAALHVSDSSGAVSVAEVIQQLERLDGDFLVTSMIRVTPNFWVLPAPDSPDKAVGLRPENIQHVLEVARERFDYVIIDIERTLDPVSIRVLDCADTIMVVLQLTLPFIRDAKRLLAAFDSLGYPRGKTRLVVNRYQRGGEISLADLESTLGVEVGYTIPNSFQAVASSVNQGRPILSLDPQDRVTKALVDMARQMEQRTVAPSGGWLSRLFSKPA